MSRDRTPASSGGGAPICYAGRPDEFAGPRGRGIRSFRHAVLASQIRTRQLVLGGAGRRGRGRNRVGRCAQLPGAQCDGRHERRRPRLLLSLGQNPGDRRPGRDLRRGASGLDRLHGYLALRRCPCDRTHAAPARAGGVAGDRGTRGHGAPQQLPAVRTAGRPGRMANHLRARRLARLTTLRKTAVPGAGLPRED